MDLSRSAVIASFIFSSVDCFAGFFRLHFLVVAFYLLGLCFFFLNPMGRCFMYGSFYVMTNFLLFLQVQAPPLLSTPFTFI